MTPGVFTTNSTVPANTIDWYAAVGSGHPFSSSTNPDPCDGIAQTLVSRQYLPANGLSPATTEGGYWWNEDVSGDQYYFETAWSLIMLNRTVFVNCVNNLTGLGVGGTSLTPARIDLSWSAIPNVTGYNVLVSTTSGGPYTQVTYNGGTTKVTAFSDRSGLTNGQTYYFVLQPINGSTTVCQSNQATIKVPKPL